MRVSALFLLLAAIGLAQETTPGSVEGRVTNSVTGDPISGATVHFYAQSVNPNASSSPTAATQADGSFRIDSLPPGSYFAVAEQSSFTNTASGVVVRVGSGQQVSNVALQLKPLGSISGKVVDENGNPVASARVTAYATYDWRGHTQLRAGQNTTTGKDGTYQLKKLVPGRYFLAADPEAAAAPEAQDSAQPRNASPALVATFYPNTLSLDGAAAIDIAPAQNAAGIAIHLLRSASHRLQGKVEEIEGDGATLKATLSLSPQGTLPWAGLSKTVKAAKDGTFSFDQVIPGAYTLWLTAAVAGGGGSRGGSVQKLLARQNIDVTAEDVTGIDLPILPPVSLTGKVVLDPSGTQNLARVRIALIPGGETMFGSYARANVNADGSFSIPRVDPGEYRVSVQGIPQGSYVQSVEYNRQDVTKTAIDLSQGGGGELDITMRMGAAEVDGTVEAAGSSGPVYGIAVLVPEQVASDGSGTLVGTVMPNGSFVVQNVPPGRYFALAVPRFTGVWQNVSFLREIEKAGTSVDVQENSRAQVQAPLISNQDIQQTAARLGLESE